MSKEIRYICNLCQDRYEFKEANGNMLAWYYGNHRTEGRQAYTLRVDIHQAECHTHICKKCATALKEELSLIDLTKM